VKVLYGALLIALIVVLTALGVMSARVPTAALRSPAALTTR
jgi:hypothetical protein